MAYGMAIAVILFLGAVYLYFHSPMQYSMPCIFHMITGLYCPGCGAGRACYSILHGQFLEAFEYNPLLFMLLPFLGIYILARIVDWVWTGGNHIDQRVNVKLLWGIVILTLVYGAARNIPVFPFTLLAPGGMGSIIG